MTELITFGFSLFLGLAARFLYMGATALSKRTNLLPVTIVLDILTVLIVGGAFTAFIIARSVVLAPYPFAALACGYFIGYSLTKKRSDKPKKDKPAKATGVQPR